MKPDLSVYIGGSSSPGEIERVKRNTEAILSISRPTKVTSTWWKHVENVGEANPPSLSHADQFAYSYCDLAEVDSADWLWVQMPPNGVVSAGAFFEFGYALKGGKKIVISGPGQFKSIFSAMAHVRFDTDEQAVEFFRKIA